MKKFISVFSVLLMAAVLVAPVGAFAQTNDPSVIAALQAQITQLLVQVRQLQAQLAAQQDGNGQQFCHTFNKNLKIGDRGYNSTSKTDDVFALNLILEKEGFLKGVEEPATYTYISEETASLVSAFQEKYRSEILAPSGLALGTGYVGPATRRKLNTLYGCKIVNSGAPVITGIEAPTTLVVGQTGTWTVKAYDPERGNLSYSVLWGDEAIPYPNAQGYFPDVSEKSQTATFTHTYNRVGTFTPAFTVTDNTGLTAKTSASVRVGNSTQSSIALLSPNGGEVWQRGTGHLITWSNANILAPANLYLLPYPLPPQCSLPECSRTLPYTIANISHGAGNRFLWDVGEVSTYTAITIPDGQYTVEICRENECDTSDAPFTITSVVTQPSITADTPSGISVNPSAVSVAVQYRITNFPRPFSGTVDLYLLKGDNYLGTISTGAPVVYAVATENNLTWLPGVYFWQTPLAYTDNSGVRQLVVAGSDYKIKVFLRDTNGTFIISDITDRPFAVGVAQPSITSISQASGPAGTTVEIHGNNLSGFEGDLIAVFQRPDGKTVELRSLTPYSTGRAGDPVNTTLIKVKLEPPCQRGQTVYGAYSGIASLCDYVEFTPGIYKVYVNPWGVKSNEVEFTVTSR